MRTVLMTILFGGLVMLASPALADPVQVGDVVQLRLTDSDGSTIARFANGGPFRFDVAGASGDFLTFCLEMNEYFTPGEDLHVRSVSNLAMAGGVAGADPALGGDPISGTTAFLYTRFRAGAAGYTNGRLVQETIWYLEQETTSASAAALGLVTSARAEMASIGWALSYTGEVAVANLYRGTNFGTRAQDMLFLQPAAVPEPSVLLLMATGLAGGLGMRRRVRQPSLTSPK